MIKDRWKRGKNITASQLSRYLSQLSNSNDPIVTINGEAEILVGLTDNGSTVSLLERGSADVSPEFEERDFNVIYIESKRVKQTFSKYLNISIPEIEEIMKNNDLIDADIVDKPGSDILKGLIRAQKANTKK